MSGAVWGVHVQVIGSGGLQDGICEEWLGLLHDRHSWF